MCGVTSPSMHVFVVKNETGGNEAYCLPFEIGKALYAARCAVCHGADFRPTQGSPPVQGAAFLANWQGRTLGDLYALLRTTMPPGNAGSLSDEEYRAAIAYILQANGFKAGQPLPADAAEWREIGFGQ